MTPTASQPESGPLGAASRYLAPVEDFANFVAGAAIFALMCLGIAQIVLRSVFNAPIAGYIDLVELSMATMAFLGAAYCQRLGAHIRMELLIGRLHGRALWAVESFALAVGLGIIGILIWYGWGHFLRAYELGDTTIDAEYPVWPSKLLVPVAFSLWFLRLSIQFVGSLRLLIDPSLAPRGIVAHKDAAELAQEEIEVALGHSSDEEKAGSKGDAS